MPDPIQTAAIHEAGHAYVAWRFGHPIDSLVLRDDGTAELASYTISDVVGSGQDRRRLARELAIVTYAGMCAERILAGLDVDPLETYEDNQVEAIMNDCHIGPRTSSYVGDEKWEAYKRELEREARKIVHAGQNSIEWLAKRLIDVRQMSGTEVERIFNQDSQIA